MMHLLKSILNQSSNLLVAYNSSINNPTYELKSLSYLWKEYQRHHYDLVIAEVKKVILQNTTSIQLEYLKLQGLCYFRLGQYELAQQSFTILSQGSKNPDDWFNLATSSTLNKNLNISEFAFIRTLELHHENADSHNLSLPFVCFYYMQCLITIHSYDRALEIFVKLIEVYRNAEKLNDTYLKKNKIPTLRVTLELAKPLLSTKHNLEVCKNIDTLQSKLDPLALLQVAKFKNTIVHRSKNSKGSRPQKTA